MQDPEYIEERVEARHSASKQSFVQYRMIELDGNEKSHASPLSDYSSSGLKLISHEPIPVGQILNMDIFLPGEERAIHLTGETRWCLEVDDVPTYHAGISFVEDGSRDYDNWRRVCRH